MTLGRGFGCTARQRTMYIRGSTVIQKLGSWLSDQTAGSESGLTYGLVRTSIKLCVSNVPWLRYCGTCCPFLCFNSLLGPFSALSERVFVLLKYCGFALVELLRAAVAPVEASATEYSPVKACDAESMLASRVLRREPATRVRIPPGAPIKRLRERVREPT
jgi:hypothetical protein